MESNKQPTSSPSPTMACMDDDDKLSFELQMRLGEMTKKGAIDFGKLVSMQSNNPKLDSIRNKTLKQMLFQSVMQTQNIEAKLEEMIKKVPMEALESEMSELRDRFLGECSKVIITDSESAQTHNMEYVLWKTAFYPLIERLRKLMNNNSVKYKAEELMQKYLNEVRKSSVCDIFFYQARGIAKITRTAISAKHFCSIFFILKKKISLFS